MNAGRVGSTSLLIWMCDPLIELLKARVWIQSAQLSPMDPVRPSCVHANFLANFLAVTASGPSIEVEQYDFRPSWSLWWHAKTPTTTGSDPSGTTVALPGPTGQSLRAGERLQWDVCFFFLRLALVWCSPSSQSDSVFLLLRRKRSNHGREFQGHQIVSSLLSSHTTWTTFSRLSYEDRKDGFSVAHQVSLGSTTLGSA